jgi:hypothetical protein
LIHREDALFVVVEPDEGVHQLMPMEGTRLTPGSRIGRIVIIPGVVIAPDHVVGAMILRPGDDIQNLCKPLGPFIPGLFHGTVGDAGLRYSKELVVLLGKLVRELDSSLKVPINI